MSWESRRNRRQYYYRVRRDKNGVLQKRYLGNGSLAHQEARKDFERRQAAAADLRQRKELESRLWSVDRRTQLLREGCHALLHAHYLVANYRLSSSRNWRKRNSKLNDDPQKNPKGSSSNEPDATQQPQAPRTFLETVDAIKAGKRGLMGNLKWFLEQSPDVYRTYGDLSAMTKTAWVRHLGGNDPVITASILLKVNEELVELLGESPTPSQRLLGERVIISKMALAYYEQLEAGTAQELVGSKMGEWVARRTRSANYQLNQAVSQLHVVRRLENEVQKDRPAGALRLYNPEPRKRSA